MNQWGWAIIPLVSLVVYLFVKALSRDQEPPPAQRPRQPQRPGYRPAPARTTPDEPASDLQRFLGEVQRMREQALAKQPPNEAPALNAPPRLLLQEERPQRPPTPRPQPQRLPANPPPTRSEPPIMVLPADAEPTPSRAVVKAAIPAQQPTAPPESTAAAPPAQATPGRVAPVAQQLLALLSSPRSLSAAILLKELLDRPISMRPRR